MLASYILQNNCLKESCISFQEILPHKTQDIMLGGASDALTANIRTSAMFLLFRVKGKVVPMLVSVSITP
jgi:hypothetical protein